MMQAKLIESHDAHDIYNVLIDLLPEDKLEIEAVRGAYDVADVAFDLNRASSWKIKVEGVKTCAVGGFAPVWAGYGTLWMFTTPEFKRRSSLELLKQLKKSMIRALGERGVRRAEARCMSSHDQSKRWIEFMGGKQDCRLPNYGIKQEEFLLYSWVF